MPLGATNIGSTGHAIVLGASMAGLLAARVLAERYSQVTVVDRDVLPPGAAHRRGVPQSRQIHALHARGCQVLEELFQGFTAHAVAGGALTGDTLADARWYLAGHRLCRTEADLVGLAASRPFLEAQVRQRVAALPGVSFLEDVDAVGLLAGQGRVVGVRVAPRRAGAAEQQLAADLVIDATGRGSRTPRWLAELGYDRPAEETIGIDVAYATRTYRLPAAVDRPGLCVVIAATPTQPRAAVLSAVEGDRYLVGVAGILGDRPPLDPPGFEALVRSVRPGDVAQAISGGEPLDNPVGFRFPASVRRRYERLRRFPRGLLVLGDAVSSFNPVYGQGMTVAALEALVLRDLLRRSGEVDPVEYFRRVGRIVDLPWRTAAAGDLAFPGVSGRRTLATGLGAAILPRMAAAAESDPVLARAVARVVSMVDRPECLLRPDRLLRALRLRASAARTGATTPTAGRSTSIADPASS